MAKKQTRRTPARKKRLRPERGAKPPSESAWGRGPTRTGTRAVATRKPGGKRGAARRPRPPGPDPLLAAVKGADRRNVGHVRLDVGRAGQARVKRMIYPAGFRWSVDMKPITGTEWCMHAHVGFLARGEIHVEYADGCVVKHKAPQIVAIEPGHDGWVVGREPVVLIEFDFEGDTVQRLGMPEMHRHGGASG